MARRIKSRRAGKGSVFEVTKRAKADVAYVSYDEVQKSGFIMGEVTELIDDRGRSTVLAEVTFDDGRVAYLPAAESLYIGQKIKQGVKADLTIGNIMPLSEVPEGCPVFNIEGAPNDGGKYARSSGSYGLVVSKDLKSAYIKMPSGSQKIIDRACRATIGCAAGGSRKDKPFVKAGKKFHASKGRGGRSWPVVRGVAMNPVSHPHGGGGHHVGRSKSVSRHAPPGAKVGAIASSRTGRRKR